LGGEFVGPRRDQGRSDPEGVGKQISTRGIERNGETAMITAEVGGEGFN
jgi:hypothetical protein